MNAKLVEYKQIPLYSLPLKNRGLNCRGSLMCGMFSVSILEKFLEIWDNLQKLIKDMHNLEISKNLKVRCVMNSYI